MKLSQSNEVKILKHFVSIYWQFSVQSSNSNLAFPFLDDSIIANLDNLIAVFQNPSRTSELDVKDLQHVLSELNTVKQKLTDIRENAVRSETSKVFRPNSAELQMMNPLTRSSIEMLKNNGKFTQPINPASLPGKLKNEKQNSKENLKSSVHHSPSVSSLRNSITVSPLSFTRRKPPVNAKILARKISRLNIHKKPEKASKPSSKQREQQTPPKIVSTLFASCRIHCYDNHSHTFEIIKPHQISSFGDTNEKSEVVFVVLPDGSSALFKSKGSKLLLNLQSIGEKNKTWAIHWKLSDDIKASGFLDDKTNQPKLLNSSNSIYFIASRSMTACL